MLRFYSANVRIVNSQRAVDECLEIAFGKELPNDCRVVIINASLGHNLDKLAADIKKQLPGAAILGSTGGGVIGRHGVGESMHDVAMMMICGPAEECPTASVNNICGSNSYEKALQMALELRSKSPYTRAVYLLCPGIDIANDLVLKAFDEVFGADMPIFGGASNGNNFTVTNFQYLGDKMTERGAWAIGFADKTLNAITRATHGFTASGNPLIVTRAEGNRIYELNGRPAWTEYTSRLGVETKHGTNCAETIPIGALAEKLPPEIAEEYGNTHILRAVTHYDASDGSIYYPATCREGTELWLTTRDEELIFSEQLKALKYIKDKIGTNTSVAVFQIDCFVRGRLMFNKIMKDEIITAMQSEISAYGNVPPWIGLYGLGEHSQLGGKNYYHNYTTALMVLFRQSA